MLRLFERPWPEEDYLELRRLVVQRLAKQLDEAVDKWEAENGIAEERYEQLSKGHFRSSTKPRQ